MLLITQYHKEQDGGNDCPPQKYTSVKLFMCRKNYCSQAPKVNMQIEKCNGDVISWFFNLFRTKWVA